MGNNSSNNDSSFAFDRIRGEDSWLGREVCKNFWIGKGKNKKQVLFRCKVTAIDDDEDNEGHRLFEVTYEDGDVEDYDVGDLLSILTPLDSAQVVVNDLCGVAVVCFVGFYIFFKFVLFMLLFRMTKSL